MAVGRARGRGLLLRSSRFQRDPSWADLRLLVESVGHPESGEPIVSRLVRVRVVGQRGGSGEEKVEVVEVWDGSVERVVSQRTDNRTATVVSV